MLFQTTSNANRTASEIARLHSARALLRRGASVFSVRAALTPRPRQRGVDWVPHVLLLVTDSLSARFLEDQVKCFVSEGWQVSCAANGPRDLGVLSRAGASIYEIGMKRSIAPRTDIVSLINFVKLIRRIQPDIVNAGTPKAGLLGMIAAWWCQVSVRVYTYTDCAWRPNAACGRLPYGSVNGLLRIALTWWWR